MLALKVAALAQAPGVRPATRSPAGGDAGARTASVVPSQGRWRSGDLAPLAHDGGGHDRCRRDDDAGRHHAADVALPRYGLLPWRSPKEGLALLDGTQFSTAHALAALFDANNLFRAALDACCRSRPPRGPMPFRCARAWAEPASWPGRVRRRAATLMLGSGIAKSRLIGDDRVQDPDRLRRQPQVMGAALDMLRHAAKVSKTRSTACRTTR